MALYTTDEEMAAEAILKFLSADIFPEASEFMIDRYVFHGFAEEQRLDGLLANLRRMGWLKYELGCYSITDEGRKALADGITSL